MALGQGVVMLLAQVAGDGFATVLIVAMIGVFGVVLAVSLTHNFNMLKDKFISINGRLDKLDIKMRKFFKWGRSADKLLRRVEVSLADGPFGSSSPLHLSLKGEEILRDSGIGEIIKQFEESLLKAVKEADVSTPYDVEESTLAVFEEFDFGEENIKKLKNYAFNSGKWDISVILRVGAIKFRDTVLKECGFEIPKPSLKEPTSDNS